MLENLSSLYAMLVTRAECTGSSKVSKRVAARAAQVDTLGCNKPSFAISLSVSVSVHRRDYRRYLAVVVAQRM